jgi:transposase
LDRSLKGKVIGVCPVETSSKLYTQEFKNQLIKEVQDTGNVAAVAKAHGVPNQTLHGWIGKVRRRNDGDDRQTLHGLRKKLADAELEILVLKELLKKTNQAWLKG